MLRLKEICFLHPVANSKVSVPAPLSHHASLLTSTGRLAPTFGQWKVRQSGTYSALLPMLILHTSNSHNPLIYNPSEENTKTPHCLLALMPYPIPLALCGSQRNSAR